MSRAGLKGIGPRYCPSIEDKITRFSERKATNCLLNRRMNTVRGLPNGFLSSLPEEVQIKALRSVPGFRETLKCSGPDTHRI